MLCVFLQKTLNGYLAFIFSALIGNEKDYWGKVSRYVDARDT
jgi:hypothetical protein